MPTLRQRLSVVPVAHAPGYGSGLRRHGRQRTDRPSVPAQASELIVRRLEQNAGGDATLRTVFTDGERTAELVDLQTSTASRLIAAGEVLAADQHLIVSGIERPLLLDPNRNVAASAVLSFVLQDTLRFREPYQYREHGGKVKARLWRAFDLGD